MTIPTTTNDMPDLPPRNFFKGKTVFVFGSTSGVAEEFAKFVAEGGAKVAAMSRSGNLKNDLSARSGNTENYDIKWDALDKGGVLQAWLDAEEVLGKPDVVLYAAGIMPSQKEMENNPKILEDLVSVNTGSAFVCMELARDRMNENGVAAFITSVSGDRARASNWAYGASKKALSFALEGLSYHNEGPHFIDVKLGFCKTKMTDGMKREGPLWSTPEDAAKEIACAIIKRKRKVYVSGIWRVVTLIFDLLPRSVIKKMKT